jgi:stalled ribosome rescue protein Dom34
MHPFVLWIDQDHAKLFRLTPGRTELRQFKRVQILHHTDADPENHRNAEPFFHDIAHELRDAKEVLILGPGLAKDHFVAHLDRHHHGELRRRVVGVETLEHLSNERILERSRQFFKLHDLYEEPVN